MKLDTIPSRRYSTSYMEPPTISATQMSILDAASKVILEKGGEALTLEAVAEVAGISKGGLLYHYPSKKKLIEAMVMRLIAEVDSRLTQELAKDDDYVAAYIRASFGASAEWNRISSALIAAVTNDRDLMKPLQARFFRMQEEISSATHVPEFGTIVRLALDGLWMSDLFGFAPPSPELREKIFAYLLEMADTTN
jgi:AcrR family transcriptional regulator